VKLKSTFEVHKETDKTKIIDGFKYAPWGFNVPLDHFLKFLRSTVFAEFITFCQNEKDKDDGVVTTPPAVLPTKKSGPAAKRAKKVIDKTILKPATLHFDQSPEELLPGNAE
jgi:hypothetical protein